MRLPDFLFVTLFALTGPAVADCLSQTATLETATVVFKCGDGQSSEASAGNVSVVVKQPEPLPEPETARSRTPVPEPKVLTRDITKTIDKVEPAKPKHQTAKSGKSRRAVHKSPKVSRAKRPAKAKNRIIHLEKPGMGRRVMQFFGF